MLRMVITRNGASHSIPSNMETICPSVYSISNPTLMVGGYWMVAGGLSPPCAKLWFMTMSSSLRHKFRNFINENGRVSLSLLPLPPTETLLLRQLLLCKRRPQPQSLSQQLDYDVGWWQGSCWCWCWVCLAAS